MVSDLNKNFGGSKDLAKKKHLSADLHTPIQPPRREIEQVASRRAVVKVHAWRRNSGVALGGLS